MENEVRLTRPQLGLKADHKNSRSAGIELFCIGCMGGSKSDAAKCPTHSCPLWGLEFKKTRGSRPEGHVPTEAQYQEMIDATVSTKQREAGRKLAEKRWEEDHE